MSAARAIGRFDPRFSAPGDFEPAYLRLHRSGELERRADEARAELLECRLCPRACGNNRIEDERDLCRVGRRAVVSSAAPHFGEEDALVGSRGSGTIFFTGCGLRCAFCQNWDISQSVSGREVNADELAGLMLGLQSQGCHNINLVTPSHVVPQILEALGIAASAGLRLPLVYNTSAYDGIRALQLLDGVVDIYMPDFKVWRTETGARYLGAKDYAVNARSAIGEMHRQVGDLVFGEDGVARRGLLVRHLVLPAHGDETAAVLGWLADLSPNTWVNLMAQYRPSNRVGQLGRGGKRLFSEMDRLPHPAEIEAAYEAATDAGLVRLDKPRLY